MNRQDRKARLLANYEQTFGEALNLRWFSAPGRVELCGNHTDHQGGQVVALAIDLDILGAATARNDRTVRLFSIGASPCTVCLDGDCPPKGTSDALIWGVAKWLEENGYTAGGFDCVTHSIIPFGAGLSSSAAFENFVATVFSGLYNNHSISPLEKALAGQWAENNCFGKPCGLMDQLASCLGNVSFMDFSEAGHPQTQTVSMPLDEIDRVLCVVKTGGSHADLTHHYAAIPSEMKAVSACFGKNILSQITKQMIVDDLPKLRQAVGDRAVLRSLNYFDECERSQRVVTALKENRVADILPLLTQSGMGSQTLLQNVSNPDDTAFDGVGMALYFSRQICPSGTYRVHGGGFGGTMLGFVPAGEFEGYKQRMEAIFGDDTCIALQVRSYGGVEI